MSNVYKPKIVFSGPIGYMSGYGEHSRYIFKYLLKHQDKYDLFLVPQQWANSTFNIKKVFSKDELNEINHLLEKTKKYADKMKTRSALKFDLSLQVGVPDDWDFEVAEKTVGITAGIETDFMRFDWLGHFIYKCEEVWVVSKHSKYAALQTVDVHAKNQAAIYGNVGEMPAEASGTKEQSQKILTNVKVFGFPARTSKLSEQSVDVLKDVSTNFNFLSVNQIGPRKNVELLIKEFIEEFKDNEDVGLILKSHMHNHSVPDKYLCEKILTQHIKSQLGDTPYKCKIYLLHGNLDEDELRSLYVHEKVHTYVSTTHGEGFGLPLFEAACSGLPIAATGWSGHMDFLSLNDSKGYLFEKISYELKPVGAKADNKFIAPTMRWAHPRPGATRKALKSCYEKQKVKKKQALKLQSLILESPKFNEDILEEKIMKRIDSLIGDLTKTYSTRKAEQLLETLNFED